MDPIVLSAIKKAKKEIVDLLHKIDRETVPSVVLELRNTLSKLDTEKLSAGDFNQMMASIQEHFLSKLDADISSRADGKDWTADRAGKVDKLDVAVSSRLSKTDFDAVLADLKKSSAEYRNRIAAVLGQMDVAGLSTEDSIKLLTQYLEDIPIIGAAGSTLTTQGGSYTIPRGYHNGSGSVRTNITNLRPENIKNGANVGGVVGTHAPQVVIEYYDVPNRRIETKSLGGTICYVCLSYSDGSYTYERELESKPIGYTLYVDGPIYTKFVSENESWNKARIKKISKDKLEASMNGGNFSFFVARRYD